MAGYVQVDVTYLMYRRGFSGVFGSGAIPVSARRRGRPCSSAPAIFLLSPNASPSFTAAGNGSLTVNVTGNSSGGAVVVDSSAANAVSASGNAALTAPQFVVAGNDTTAQNGTITTNPTANNIQTNASQVPNPLSSLPTPSTSGMTTQSTTCALRSPRPRRSRPASTSAGSRSPAMPTSLCKPGTYYMEGGGFTVKNNATRQTAATA